jgi:hypothetical protein
MDPVIAKYSSIRKEGIMLRTRFSHIRAAVGIAVLSLALLAGIAGTTQPAEARINAEAFCADVRGFPVYMWVRGVYTFYCQWEGGIIACEYPGSIIFGSCKSYI